MTKPKDADECSRACGCSSAPQSPDDQIDVWEITPHLNTDYDIAIYDSPERVIMMQRIIQMTGEVEET